MNDTTHNRSHPPNPLVMKIAPCNSERKASSRMHRGTGIPRRYRSTREADETDGAAYGEWCCEHPEELLLSRVEGDAEC